MHDSFHGEKKTIFNNNIGDIFVFRRIEWIWVRRSSNRLQFIWSPANIWTWKSTTRLYSICVHHVDKLLFVLLVEYHAMANDKWSFSVQVSMANFDGLTLKTRRKLWILMFHTNQSRCTLFFSFEMQFPSIKIDKVPWRSMQSSQKYSHFEGETVKNCMKFLGVPLKSQF